MIRLKCEYCQQTIVEGGRVADQKTAYYAHRAACKPQHKGINSLRRQNNE